IPRRCPLRRNAGHTEARKGCGNSSIPDGEGRFALCPSGRPTSSGIAPLPRCLLCGRHPRPVNGYLPGIPVMAPMRDALLPTLHAALASRAAQARRVLTSYPGYTPMYTVGGKWHREGERWTHWCEGFFPGILWLLYKRDGDPYWREHADRYSRALEPRRL